MRRNEPRLGHYYNIDSEVARSVKAGRKKTVQQYREIQQAFYASFFTGGHGDRYDEQEVNGFHLVKHKDGNGGWKIDLYSKESFRRYKGQGK